MVLKRVEKLPQMSAKEDSCSETYRKGGGKRERVKGGMSEGRKGTSQAKVFNLQTGSRRVLPEKTGRVEYNPQHTRSCSDRGVPAPINVRVRKRISQ